MRGRECLVDVLDRQSGGLGQLGLRRLAPQLDLEPAGRAAELLLPLDDVDRYADRAGVVGDGALHRLPDPPGGVRGELVAAPPVELLDCAVQTERPLLDQIQERHTEPPVALRDRHDQAEVGLDHAPLRRRVAALDRLGEVDLFRGGQQLVTSDVGEEELQAVGGAADGSRVVGRGRRGRRLCLVGGLAHLEPDRLELTRQLLDLLLPEVVLERECLELCRLDEPALLGALDQQARLIALKQLVQLILGQVTPVVLSPSSRTDTASALGSPNFLTLTGMSSPYQPVQRTTIPLEDCEESNAWL